MKFHVGDRVVWWSEAQGHRTRKRGTVAVVVPRGRSVHDVLPAGIDAPVGCGVLPRNHESYLVKVDGKRVPYWPRVCHLAIQEPKG